MSSSHHTGTPLKHEDKVYSSDDDLVIFDSSSSDEDDESSSDPDDYCHHIEKVGTNVQIFNIFINSLIITN
jgi:hypothetical protein